MNDQTTIPVPYTSSACDRVLTAVRIYRREHGRSPSLGEIARRAAVRRQHVARYLIRLQLAGLLTYDRHAPEPIILTDPAANLSDLDLENGCHSRGWTIVKSPVPMMVDAFPLDPSAPSWGSALINQLGMVD